MPDDSLRADVRDSRLRAAPIGRVAGRPVSGLSDVGTSCFEHDNSLLGLTNVPATKCHHGLRSQCDWCDTPLPITLTSKAQQLLDDLAELARIDACQHDLYADSGVLLCAHGCGFERVLPRNGYALAPKDKRP